eukprot:Gb_01444 [translate_table: standard]
MASPHVTSDFYGLHSPAMLHLSLTASYTQTYGSQWSNGPLNNPLERLNRPTVSASSSSTFMAFERPFNSSTTTWQLLPTATGVKQLATSAYGHQQSFQQIQRLIHLFFRAHQRSSGSKATQGPAKKGKDEGIQTKCVESRELGIQCNLEQSFEEELKELVELKAKAKRMEEEIQEAKAGFKIANEKSGYYEVVAKQTKENLKLLVAKCAELNEEVKDVKALLLQVLHLSLQMMKCRASSRAYALIYRERSLDLQLRLLLTSAPLLNSDARKMEAPYEERFDQKLIA